MRVLFAHDHYFKRVDDAVYSESQFEASLWERYLEVFDDVLVFARNNPASIDAGQSVVSSRSNVRFLLNDNISSLSGLLFGKKKVRRTLRARLKETDAVIARLPSEFGLLAIDEARRAGLPCAIEMVGCPWDGLWNYGSLKGKVYAPLMTLRVRNAVAKCSHVIYVTNKFLQSRYPNRRGVVVGCSDVQIDPPSQDALRNKIRRLESGNPRLVLGLIGTFKTRYKGIQTVMQALATYRDSLPELEFRVIGAGDPSPWVFEARNLGIGDLVKFQGALPGGQPVLDWLDEVDLYLQPSFKEGLPRALIEAMSRACPAIASRCAGIPELLDHSCLIEPGDADHLGRLLVEALADRKWMIEQGRTNWQTAQMYSSENLDAKRFQFWQSFCAYVMEAANAGKE